MPHPYIHLTIDSVTYQGNELASFALSRLASFSTEPWEFGIYSFIVDWISDKETMIVKTSGSTGEPMKMEVKKAGMIKSAEMTADYFNYQKGDKALLCLPADFIAGKMMIVRAFVSGLNLVTMEPSSDPTKNISEAIHFAAMTPMQIYQVLKSSDGFEKLNQIKQLIIGGGDIDLILLEKIRKLQNESYHTYGMTETLTHIALKRLNGDMPDAYFKAMDGVSLETDNRNCLLIHAPHLPNQPIVTNDVVELKSENEFEFRGRYDNVINSGGIKLFPEQIEQKLKPFIKQSFFIFGMPDEKLGEIAALVIEGKESTSLTNRIEELPFSKFEKPKKILFRDKLIRTSSGKIKREI